MAERLIGGRNGRLAVGISAIHQPLHKRHFEAKIGVRLASIRDRLKAIGRAQEGYLIATFSASTARVAAPFNIMKTILFVFLLTAVKSFSFRTFQLQFQSDIGSQKSLRRLTTLHSSSENAGPNPSANKKLSQIATLNLMAAKLRSEAAELEVR